MDNITNINLAACPLQYLSIGYVGETGARPVAFDFSAWATEYGAGVLQLLLQRPGDANPYPVLLDIDGTTATWTPDDTDTKTTGQGQAQLVYTVGGVVVKNAIFRVLIAPSLGAAGDPPEPYENWLQRLLIIAAEAQQSAIDAAGSAEAAGTSAGAAAGSAGAAAQSALDAEAAKSGAETAEQTAQQAAALARAKAAEAAEAAQIAGREADYAQQQNIAAGYSAESAHDDAERAAQSSEDAQAAASAAQTAASAAAASASAAAGSAANAASTVTEVETKGAEQITAINQSGTTQIAAVDAAGAAQVQAIEDKGEEVIASIPSDYTELADDVSDLKSSLNKAPEIKDSTEQEADLDISDAQGNVILRLVDGHIKTKKFDSQSVTSEIVKDSTATGIDFDVADPQGNVILRLKNGELATKWFSSENIDGSADYNVDVAYSNAAGSATIEADFHRGDTVVLHFADADDRITGRIANYNVTYSYTAADGTSHTMCAEYGYKYPEYTFPEDAVSVTVTYGTSLLWGESGNLRFSVYKKGLTERAPHIIKVALDGSGDFMSLRSAVDSITDNNAYNRYQIEVHPGTYEILSDYTDAEISAAGFKGLFIGDGLSLVGIGHPGEVVLHGTLDTSSYSSTKRNDVSVINIAGNVRLENLTINAENMRYCVHDDTSPMAYQPVSKEIKNCVMNAHTMTTRDIAYGCGISGQRKLHIVGCVFNQEIHLHTHGNASFAPEVILEDCEGSILSVADYNSTVGIIYSVRNCKFSMLSGEIVSAPHQQYLFVNQIGGTEPIVDCEAGQIYNLSNCIAVRGTVTAGQLVNVSRGASRMAVTAVSTKAVASGVSIGTVGENTIVASGGYINSNQVGLSGLSAGEYITIDSDGALIGGGTESNAVGVVKALSTRQNGGAYIKLFV